MWLILAYFLIVNRFLEIISFALTLFGRGDLVDNTLGGSDLVWVPMSYAPYQPPQPPIIIHETIHHHH